MFFPAYLLFVFISVACAANDWPTPCTSGWPSLDLPASAGSSSGTVKIPLVGKSSAALPTQLQDIRLVQGRKEKLSAYQNRAVRQECVRAGGESVRPRRSVNSSHHCGPARLPGWPTPKVRGPTLDTNFGAVDASRRGNINFALQAATVPGANGNIVIPAQGSQRRSRLPARGLGDFIGDTIRKLKEFDTANSTSNPFGVDKSVDVGASAHGVVDIGFVASGTLAPFDISDFGITATLTADINGTLSLVVNASGTLDSGKIKILPDIPLAGLGFDGLLIVGPGLQVNAEAKAVLDLNMELTVGLNYHIDQAQIVFPLRQGQATSGSFNLGDTPLKLSASPAMKAAGSVEAHLIPSLNLGISAIGGTVKAEVFLALDASATMQLSLEAQAQAGVTVGNANKRTVGATEAAPPSTTKFAVQSNTTSAKALTSGSAGPVVQGSSAQPTETNISTESSAGGGNSTEITAGSSTLLPSTSLGAALSASPTSLATTSSASASFGGCFEIKAELNVNAGADGAFLGLFDPSTQVTLFNKEFELFKDCFGTLSQRRSLPRLTRIERLSVVKRAELTCLPEGVGALVSVTDKTVKAAEATAL
ncbi:hypothetical protein BD779DRAFT_1677327 [Infundibulicybe gibba]|nr:hypothetical protein BD779DRAFT_1677327 [Infundibulicybe gibba]